MNSIEFIFGEDKKIRVTISSTQGDPFTIASAQFELSRNGTVVAEGNCQIDHHQLIFQLRPAERGTYTLMITYEIAEEVFKTRYALSVV